MKSKPEYRHIFSSPSMFYRALHTISSQKYRMPVRRYIFDLFNIDLDADVVKQLSDCAIALRVPLTAPEAAGPSPAQEKPRETVVPTFQPRPARPVVSESDDEESHTSTTVMLSTKAINVSKSRCSQVAHTFAHTFVYTTTLCTCTFILRAGGNSIY